MRSANNSPELLRRDIDEPLNLLDTGYIDEGSVSGMIDREDGEADHLSKALAGLHYFIVVIS